MDLEPLYGLRLRTPRLELRWPTPEELAALGRLARAGIHDPDRLPFLVPWTDPSETFVEDFTAYHEGLRRDWRPEAWNLECAVLARGELIGIQGMEATRFAETRTVTTGSWLGRAFQGRGLGTEMRSAVLSLAFSGLGAVRAHTAAMDHNVASQRVSAKFGYLRSGERWPVVRGQPVRELTYTLSRERFSSLEDPVPVEIDGLDGCRACFGADSAGGAGEPRGQGDG
ncbi:GNAT family N-acetyltransferase [Conexibacter sp. DBS9H8]|uniref:GNAT family N-acetyltransferase n=1 Tax=Conexibacter sp. DBS9H8 TaxID=2937801 RepID=UPI00200E403B|nr:GNAT family protein [Conexibacter sp. DBS9H8]